MSRIMMWRNVETIRSRSFVCGHCGSPIASEKGYAAYYPDSSPNRAAIMICHRCQYPTFFDEGGNQTPGITFGQPVSEITDKAIAAIYDEARKATGAGCYSAAVLACRKLLMHIAVVKGAEEGLSFIAYVEYLSDKNYIPPDAKGWVDHIRKKGNEANHELTIMKKEDAEELVSFIEMLLKVIFEFPAQVKRKYGKDGDSI
ncbi:MAG: DUF4145 domain-containing protein [Smithellaceae bacterium]|nr:DUF4145 domain-containing protein [Smithellaceae bacterium]